MQRVSGTLASARAPPGPTESGPPPTVRQPSCAPRWAIGWGWGAAQGTPAQWSNSHRLFASVQPFYPTRRASPQQCSTLWLPSCQNPHRPGRLAYLPLAFPATSVRRRALVSSSPPALPCSADPRVRALSSPDFLVRLDAPARAGRVTLTAASCSQPTLWLRRVFCRLPKRRADRASLCVRSHHDRPEGCDQEC